MMSNKPFYEKLLSFPKWALYIVMFLVVLLPLIFGWKFKTNITPEVSSIFDNMEQIYKYNQTHPNDIKGIFLSFDYTPSTNAELDPMALAVLRHAFFRKIPVLSWAYLPDTLAMGERILHYAAKEYGAVYGKDYVYLGYPVPMTAGIISFSTDIRTFMVKDYYGIPTKDIPLLEKIHNWNSIDTIVTISGSSMPRFWVTYANTMYGKKIATGTTAVSAADFYPFIASHQMIGMMGGLRGAAEYEKLEDDLEQTVHSSNRANYLKTVFKNKDLSLYDSKYYKPGFSEDEVIEHVASLEQARRGMSAQAFAHFYVIILIIIGNIAFFMKRKKEKR